MAGLAIGGTAWAGPPLVTDDTGILAPGEWEFIGSVARSKRDIDEVWDLPAGEVSYGLTDASQMTVALSRIELQPDDAGSKSDFGYLSLGYKHRLWAGDEVTWVVAPAYDFPVHSSSADRGVIDDLRILSLPVVASWERDRWLLTGQVAYELTSSGPNGWSWGTWVGYMATDSLTLLAEIWGVNVVGESESESNWNLGFDYALTEKWALLVAYGGNLRSDLPGIERLDSSIFLGIRYGIPARGEP